MLKPVWETHARQVPYTVLRPVWETCVKQIPYTVMQPVWETRTKQVAYTVLKPVWETARQGSPLHGAEAGLGDARQAGSVHRSCGRCGKRASNKSPTPS